MKDTSHYAHCLTLMQKHRRNHLQRFVLLCILLVFNMYSHVMLFGKKYAGELVVSYNSRLAENGEEINNVTPFIIMFNVTPFILPGILFSVISVLLFLLALRQNSRKKAIPAYAGSLVFICLPVILSRRTPQTAAAGTDAGVTHLAFGMAMFTLLLSLACAALALFGIQEKLWMNLGLLGLLLFGMLTDAFEPIIAIFLIVVYGIALKEVREARWVHSQPGYPYFSERFDYQQEHSEYEIRHSLKAVANVPMPEIGDNEKPNPDFVVQEKSETYVMPSLDFPEDVSEHEK